MMIRVQAAKRQTANPIGHLLIFGITAFLILTNLILLWSIRDRLLGGYTDFRVFYSSALLVKQGRGDQLYNQQVQGQLQDSLFPDETSRPDTLPFNHPAYETLLWLPLTLMSYQTGTIAWLALNGLILIGLSVYMASRLSHLRMATALGGLLAFAPLTFTLLLGQDSIILLAIYTFAFFNLKKGRPYSAGAILALGLFRFHLVLPFVFILLLCRHWRFVAGFCLAALVPIIGSVYITGLSGSRDYINLLLYESRYNAIQQHVHIPTNMPNLRGLLSLLCGNGATTERLVSPLTVVGSVGLLVLVYIIWRRRRPSLEVQTFVALIITTLVSYYMYAYDLALLLLPIALMSNQEFGRGTEWRKWAFGGTILLLSATPLYIILGVRTAVACMALPLLFLLCLLLVGAGKGQFNTPTGDPVDTVRS
jgi:hypothetical protein